LQRKGSKVWTVTPDTTVLNTLKLMTSKDVGALLVTEGDRIAGIVSERDFVRTVATVQQCKLDAPISNFMTRDVIQISSDQTVADCMHLMNTRNIRHLPVVDHGKLVGLVSIRDLAKELLTEREELTHQTGEYLEV
jgi:CBS domain-containing protein